jgi:hypothetical protein
MEYRTVFDIATAGYKSWYFPTFGLIFVTAGAILVANRKNLPSWWAKHPRASNVFAFYFFGFAVLWTLVSFFSTYSQYSSLSKARSASDLRVAEGVVTNFKPMPAIGHAMERFCVSRVCFEYSDYVIAGGFNNTTSHGGPIREGLQVRVSYVGNSIVKLEVAK